MPKTKVGNQKLACVITNLESSVPRDIAAKACGVTIAELNGWQVEERLEQAEASAYANLIRLQHAQALMGEPRPLQELLTKRFDIGSSTQTTMINKVLAVAERVLTPEWYAKLLEALSET